LPKELLYSELVQEHPSAPISRLNEVLLAIGATVLLLVPCLWQETIQAGDLSSHVYNAWLAGEIKNGSAPGLYLTHPWTNVLSDWVLEALLKITRPAAAERIVCGAAVLLFFWGAFYLIYSVTCRRPWLLAPGLSMLAYGLVFNLGFLNFYISTAASLWIIGLLWRATPARLLYSAPLWILAILAHPMPVAWAVFVLGYAHLLRRLPARIRATALPAALAAIVGAQFAVTRFLPYRWSFDQSFSALGVLGLTGAEQVFLSGPKYLIVTLGLLAIGCALFLERIDQGGMARDPLIHIWVLQAAGFILAPAALQFPQYQHVLAYIPQRLSLFNAIILCAIAGGARHGRGITRLTALVATIYFTFLFLDVRAFNSIERQVQSLIDRIPPGQRVVAEIADSNSRLSPLLHVADMACIGRCFSYANYEAATGQFRIRASGPNAVVASSMATVHEIEDGTHVITPAEAPIYSVCNCAGSLCVRRLSAGEKTCSFSLAVSPALRLSGND
jgi:hypothetical protein